MIEREKRLKNRKIELIIHDNSSRLPLSTYVSQDLCPEVWPQYLEFLARTHLFQPSPTISYFFLLFFSSILPIHETCHSATQYLCLKHTN